MDLSYRAADILGFARNGTGEIQVQYVGPAPLEGDDSRMLLASLNRTTSLEQQAEVRVAAAAPVVAPVPATRPAEGERINFADYTSAGSGTLGAFTAANPAGLPLAPFGYVEAEKAEREITGAHAAVDAVAARADALDDWRATVDDDARAVHLELGTFPDPARAEIIAESFAMLGAVDMDPVAGSGATRLTLSHLKPGVAPDDVLARAQALGLGALVLY
jgi:rare lipoprotein A